MTKTTVRTYKDNGPDFEATVMSYSAMTLRELIFHTRLAMRDGEDYIGIFDGDQCVGAWESAAEPHAAPCYLLRRPRGPLAGQFNAIAGLFS